MLNKLNKLKILICWIVTIVVLFKLGTDSQKWLSVQNLSKILCTFNEKQHYVKEFKNKIKTENC